MKDHQIISLQQSGQISSEGKVCKVHGERVKYYCETERRQVCAKCLDACPTEHKIVMLKDAAMKQRDSLEEMMNMYGENQKNFEKASASADKVLTKLCDSVKQTKTDLAALKKHYLDQLEQLFDKHIDEIEKVEEDRVKYIEDKKKAFEGEIHRMKEIRHEVSDLTQSKSDFLITSKYASMCEALKELSIAKPVFDMSVGVVKFESIPMAMSSPGYLVLGNRWKMKHQFSVKPLQLPHAIAINQDGDIIVTSFVKGVKVFSRTGQVKCSFMEDCCKITGVAVSHDNRYIVTSGGHSVDTTSTYQYNVFSAFEGLLTPAHDYRAMQCYTSVGKHLSNVLIKDSYNNKSYASTVAIDSHGRIIVGLVHNTISIHYADGSPMSKFGTESMPFRLAATSDDEIVCSFRSDIPGDVKTLKLMDYAGSNVREIVLPYKSFNWTPGCVCCRQGEIFVVSKGNPKGVFRYTAKGDYLGCVTTEVSNPGGIALSQDGMELFVVEIDDCLVKVFHRE